MNILNYFASVIIGNRIEWVSFILGHPVIDVSFVDSLIDVGPNSLRVGLIDYDEVVHTPYFGLRESAENLTSEEIRGRNIGQTIPSTTSTLFL